MGPPGSSAPPCPRGGGGCRPARPGAQGGIFCRPAPLARWWRPPGAGGGERAPPPEAPSGHASVQNIVLVESLKIRFFELIILSGN